jgi:hypothetical protein
MMEKSICASVLSGPAPIDPLVEVSQAQGARRKRHGDSAAAADPSRGAVSPAGEPPRAATGKQRRSRSFFMATAVCGGIWPTPGLPPMQNP